jgi:hypothetical protein
MRLRRRFRIGLGRSRTQPARDDVGNRNGGELSSQHPERMRSTQRPGRDVLGGRLLAQERRAARTSVVVPVRHTRCPMRWIRLVLVAIGVGIDVGLGRVAD